ncbi:PREDICTED: uncharacterized protein LOC105127421 isoform X2 [Populus euphratica]|uniref:Uncharacterized protein LOC105127421 isoform X2 n=1 Tax=Populus euphratica TaxID=75702 RepID=A0AAJ6UBU6_POPEU|nr:PREDICTED: uncharacterized protein LOC105127421 isoform X2 [Populus euphratica]
MLSTNDPMESFMNSIQVVKDAFSPLELGIRKAAKDLETCWGVSKNDDKATHDLVTDNSSKVSIFTVENKSVSLGNSENRQGVVNEEKKKGFLTIKFPIRSLLGMFSMNLEGRHRNGGDNKAGLQKKALKEKEMSNEDGSCVNCLRFAMTLSLLVSGLVQAFPGPFKMNKKRFQKVGDEDKEYLHSSKTKVSGEMKQRTSKGESVNGCQNASEKGKEGKHVSLECFIGFLFDQLAQNLQKIDLGLQERDIKGCENNCSTSPPASSQFDHLRAIISIWEGQKVYVDGVLGNLSFARVGGVPSSIVGVSSSVNEEGDDGASSAPTNSSEDTGISSPQNRASGILSIPLSNVERLRSTLSTVSLTELIELVPQLGRSSKDYPDKKKLFSVQDFFRYTEAEGRRFFEELDRDGDGQVNLEDLEIALRKRKLPQRYAREFMRRARSHLFSKSFGWKQFLSLMEQKEPTILRAYTSLCLSKSGTLQKSEILASLKNSGLPVNEDNAVAMMRFLNADTEESISYGHFRNFMLLLPSDRLQDDPRNIWFEAATVVAVAPPVEIPAGSVLRSALAGGLSCALSCSLMHPVDTIKTRVQASTLTFPEIISKLPQVGVRGLYRGSVPAIWGQFTSHGLRTGIFEATKLVLINVAPTLPDIQVMLVIMPLELIFYRFTSTESFTSWSSRIS